MKTYSPFPLTAPDIIKPELVSEVSSAYPVAAAFAEVYTSFFSPLEKRNGKGTGNTELHLFDEDA